MIGEGGTVEKREAAGDNTWGSWTEGGEAEGRYRRHHHRPQRRVWGAAAPPNKARVEPQRRVAGTAGHARRQGARRPALSLTGRRLVYGLRWSGPAGGVLANGAWCRRQDKLGGSPHRPVDLGAAETTLGGQRRPPSTEEMTAILHVLQ